MSEPIVCRVRYNDRIYLTKKGGFIYHDILVNLMSFKSCEECGKEMERVIGFPGYVWCRDCHITKKVEERNAMLVVDKTKL